MTPADGDDEFDSEDDSLKGDDKQDTNADHNTVSFCVIPRPPSTLNPARCADASLLLEEFGVLS